MRFYSDMALSRCFIAVIAISALSHNPARACEKAEFTAAVSEANTAISQMNERNKSAFQQKLQTLKTRHSWSDADYVANATVYVKDERTADFDARGKALLAEAGALGGGDATQDRCAMLGKLKALLADLVRNTDAKWAHMHQKLDTALGAKPGFATANTLK
jgi:hypothetical protein